MRTASESNTEDLWLTTSLRWAFLTTGGVSLMQRSQEKEEATFKQYKKSENTWVLHPLDPKYPDIVLNKNLEYRIVRVVMEKKRYK